MNHEQDEQSVATEHDFNPGATLKQAREIAGLSLDDVAQKLYLKVETVNALECNDLDDGKSLTFIKGYVKNYAKIVGVDVDTIITQFEQFHHKAEDTAKLQSFSKRVAKQAHDDRWMMVTYFILIIIVGGVIWWWVQQPSTSSGNITTTPMAMSEDKLDETPINQPSSSEVLNQEVESNAVNDAQGKRDFPAVTANDTPVAPLTDSTPTNLTRTDDSSDTQTSSNNDLASVDTPVYEDELLADDDTNAQGTPVSVVFTFSQDCWVNIVDGTGEAIAYGVKAAGRVMEIEGVPPFEVTLGAPQAVSIVYNGEAVDMSRFTGNQIGKLVLPQQD